MTEQTSPSALHRFKSYPVYKDSGVEWLGEIPAHWQALALKRVVDPARPVTYGIVRGRHREWELESVGRSPDVPTFFTPLRY